MDAAQNRIKSKMKYNHTKNTALKPVEEVVNVDNDCGKILR